MALQATLGAAASLAMAYLSYEFFEKRFLSLKRLFETAKEPAPQPGCGAPPHRPVGSRGEVRSVSCSLRFSNRSGFSAPTWPRQPASSGTASKEGKEWTSSREPSEHGRCPGLDCVSLGGSLGGRGRAVADGASSTSGRVFRQARCCRAICPAPISAAFTSRPPGCGGRNPPAPGPPRSRHNAARPAASPTGRCAPPWRGRPAGGSPHPRTPPAGPRSGGRVPATASMPSAPSVVETMAFPIAMASTILRRVPPPSRSGTTTAAAAARCGLRSATKPVSSTRGPASACSDGGGRPPMILKRACGCASAMRGQISLTKWITPSMLGTVESSPKIDDGAAVRRGIGGARPEIIDVRRIGNDHGAGFGNLIEQTLFVRGAAKVDAVGGAVGLKLLPPQLAPVGFGVEPTARAATGAGVLPGQIIVDLVRVDDQARQPLAGWRLPQVASCRGTRTRG